MTRDVAPLPDLPVPGVRTGEVTRWLEANVDGARGPFQFEVIAGGHSNLTFKVTSADGDRYVLRRPPLGHVLASAHDMGREHRVIAALAGSAVPVPPVKGFCDDPEVNEVPFYVMRFVDGFVLRDLDSAERSLSVGSRDAASRSLIDISALSLAGERRRMRSMIVSASPSRAGTDSSGTLAGVSKSSVLAGESTMSMGTS